MSIMDLLNKKCIACEGGVEPFAKDQVKEYLKETPGWKLSPDGLKIKREFEFSVEGGPAPTGIASHRTSGEKTPFQKAMDFVNRVAEIAEDEGHHPDIHVFYNHVHLELSTHAIGGLSENDFILAAKINTLLK